MTQKEQIFEILGVKPNEIFQIKGYEKSLFLIDKDLTIFTNINGWSQASFSIAEILNGKLTIIKKKEDIGCEYCSQTPVFLDGMYYDRNNSGKPYVSSAYEGAYIGANEKGKIVMWVCGDDISDDYPLNYCPECGRKLKEDR